MLLKKRSILAYFHFHPPTSHGQSFQAHLDCDVAVLNFLNAFHSKEYLKNKVKYLLLYCKGICFYETRQKIFRLLGGKTEFEIWPLRQCWAVGPIQILFSRQGV